MRQDSKLCRLCTKSSRNISTIPLFERTQKATLRRIFQLTGVKLKNLGNIPTAMCAHCETELNRAYEFRERCMNSQKYFSSAEYKTRCDQTHKENRYCGNKTTDAESTVLKMEVMCVTEFENEDGEIESGRDLENSPEALEDGGSEFEALNEDEIDNLSYGNGDAEPLDRSMVYKTHKLALGDKATERSEINLENPKKRHDRAEDAMLMAVAKANEAYNLKNSKIQKKTTFEKEQKNKAGIYICDQCGNHFKYRGHFYSHIIRHTGIKPLQCEVCPNKFFTEGELKRHMRRHTGERPFPCRHCSRRFTDYSTRTKHERTHTNERPFECQQCDKAFTTSYVLKNHMLVHTGERSFKCGLCNKSFQRQTHLIAHTRSLSHKQNVEREEQKLMQQKSDEIISFPSHMQASGT